MHYLLDTMAVVRLADGTAPPKLMRRLERAERLFVSVVTPWEMALKRLPGMTNDKMQELILGLSAELLPVTMEHTGIVAKLPEFREHRDPFDRMIIAQALDERCPVVTADARFALYKKTGLETVWG